MSEFERDEVSEAIDPASLEVAKSLGERALSIGVFCSARDLSERLTEPVRELARLIGENGYDLVWGGSDSGTMHVVSFEAKAAGARIIGVTNEELSRKRSQVADEMVITKTLSERKMAIVERSSAVVVLPGGTGTLDELADIVERKKYGHHFKPIIVLNSDGFYEGLRIQFDRMEKEGVLNRALSDIIEFVSTPEEAMSIIAQKQAKKMSFIMEAVGAQDFAQISGGHSGALIYRISRQTKDDETVRSVIKVSEDERSTREVKSNIKAYVAIHEAGPSELVPKIIDDEDPVGRKYILMPDLGETITFQARSEIGADYEGFLNSFGQAFRQYLKPGESEHSESIRLTQAALKKYLLSLSAARHVEQHVIDMLDQLDIEAMSTNMSSLFLLDFTPDNVFVKEAQIQFIDPWEQSTYIGSPIISLAQFYTLARSVYELPGIASYEDSFETLFREMAHSLGLSDAQLYAQRHLGAALQYSLSSFTRQHSDTVKAQDYADRATESLALAVEATK